MPYDHISIEKKWQKFWSENKIFETTNETIKPKKYILDMFPYPSGAGLHVGHPKGYTATDIVSRYYHANGYNVLHPMGFDAFGLPAENYAIKTGTHPAITTAENIATFIEQMKNLGFSYDWDRMVDTTDPGYYRWTQWIFTELFKKGLVYEQDLPINYCPSCKTGLANEEVLSDNTCDRCGTRVEKRKIRQWVLRITEYADRLLSDLDILDWPEGIKEMQRNWIGKSEGCEFRMMKRVEGKPVALVLHGWETSTTIERHWQIWLKGELEKSGYEVIMPELPEPYAPNLEKQLASLEEYKERMNEDSIVIGHSAGGFLAMHFVERLTKKIHGLFCVAPIFYGLHNHVDWSGFPGWDVGLVSMKTAYSPEKIKSHVNNWQIFLSSNDKYIIFDEAKKHFDSISVAHTDISQAGHFCKNDGYTEFSELLESIVPSIRVYTTRVDTVFGMTYAVLAPDHPSVDTFITGDQREVCQKYIEGVKGKSDLDRTNEGKEKSGVFTGSYVINPYNGESVPLWIADYVLGSYGTGAVMAVPAHDARDFEFAKQYSLEIRQSIANSFEYTGIDAPRKNIETLKRKTIDVILENEKGEILLEVENHSNGTHIHLVGGGIEDGESEIEALRKEIIEETGYTDFEIIGAVNLSYAKSLGYRAKKNGRNQECIGRVFHVKLTSYNQIPSEIEQGKHTVKWVKKEEVYDEITWLGHKYFWNWFYHGERPTSEDGILVNSLLYDGLSSSEARDVLSKKAENEGFGHKKINYKLRDWLFSRQRYWGEPIPLIHISHEDYAKLPRIETIEDAKVGIASVIATKEAIQEGKSESLVIDGQMYSEIYEGINGKIIIDSSLPVTLPQVEKYEPAGDGQSPLATVAEWVNVKLADNLTGKRETNTMPQWGGSCWYYLRYMDSKNTSALAGKEIMDYWQNVDEYVGGAEHAVLHLLYARFWHKVLYDIGVVPTLEPFQKLTNVGMILAYAYEREDGGLVAVDLVEEVNLPVKGVSREAGGGFFESSFIEKSTGFPVKQVVAKMSKSLKNVINPNDIVTEYGADTLRLYEMSMSAFTDTAPWNPLAIVGVRRFLDRAYMTFTEGKNIAKDEMKAMKLLHKTVKKVGEDIVEYKFNTAISALMILCNEGLPADPEFQQEWKEKFATMLHPFAPHMAEELYMICHPESSRHSDEGRIQVSEHGSFVPQDDGAIYSIYDAPWPTYDDFMLIDDEVTIAIQVNGKLRGTLTCINGVMQDEVSTLAHADPDIFKWIEGKALVREIYIPNKLLSIVVKDE